MAKIGQLRTHVLVCAHKHCLKRGGRDSARALRRALKSHDLDDQVLTTEVDCLDRCDEGPCMAVYPEGVWYGAVTESAARRIVEQHLAGGRPVEEKVLGTLGEKRKDARGGRGRTLVVGDIHGCYDELTDLLDAARFGPHDRLVAVGDLVVKGEKNREVLDLFMNDARFSSVLGNHDRAVLSRRRDPAAPLKESQQQTYDELLRGGEHYFTYLRSLPLMIDLGGHLVVHAGVRPGVALGAQDEDDLVELRTLGGERTNREGVPWYAEYDGDKTVLFGHWPAAEPRRGPRALGLDTGCVYGYELTAYVVETGELLRVPARRAYAAPATKGTADN